MWLGTSRRTIIMIGYIWPRNRSNGHKLIDNLFVCFVVCLFDFCLFVCLFVCLFSLFVVLYVWLQSFASGDSTAHRWVGSCQRDWRGGANLIHSLNVDVVILLVHGIVRNCSG